MVSKVRRDTKFMGASWGHVPTDTELTATLQALSKRLYNGQWAVGIAVYNAYRDHRLAAARRILNSRGLPGNGDGWATLVHQLTGQQIRPVEESRREAASHRWSRISEDTAALNAPIERLGPSGWQLAPDAPEGLTVIARERPVMAWCCKNQTYIKIGYELVYEVR